MAPHGRKVTVTPLDVEVSQTDRDGTWTVTIWEAAFDWTPGLSSETLRWLRGYGTSEEDAVASLLHDRYVSESE